ncbi:MAG: PaaI family thioesterase [Rhodospirillales bacterium]
MNDLPAQGASGLAQRLEAARSRDDAAAFLACIPYARFLDLTAELAEGRVRLTLPFDPSLIGNTFLPAIHGGALAGLLEMTASMELLWQHQSIGLPKVVTTTVDFRRSAAARDCYAQAEVTRLGRRLATVSVTAWQDASDRPVASAQAHFKLDR